MGLFDPSMDEVYIDPINLNDERYLRRTITHELVHKAQKVLGKMGYYIIVDTGLKKKSNWLQTN